MHPVMQVFATTLDSRVLVDSRPWLCTIAHRGSFDRLPKAARRPEVLYSRDSEDQCTLDGDGAQDAFERAIDFVQETSTHIPPICTIKRADDRHDRGNTLVEMLIVIMLMGVVVTALLSAMQVTIKATTVDREQAVAFSILQAASDQIFTGPHESCLTGNAVSTYNARAQGAAIPTAWQSSPSVALPGVSIDVISVEYLGRAGVDDDFEWGSFCFEGPNFGDSPLKTQRVIIQLTFPDGTTTQTLEMVKST